MKKTLCGLLILSLLFSLTGCGWFSSKITLPEGNFTVEFRVENFRDHYNSVKMIYPEIANYDGDVDEINQILAEELDRFYAGLGLASDEEDFYSFEITDIQSTLITRDFLSLLILSEYFGSNSSHLEYMVLTLNLDLKEKVLYQTEDFFSDFSPVKSLFLQGKFAMDFGDESLMEELSWEDLFLPYRLEYLILPMVYFREGEFCLAIETSHVNGGYAGYSINIQKIEDYLLPSDVSVLLTTDVG